MMTMMSIPMARKRTSASWTDHSTWPNTPRPLHKAPDAEETNPQYGYRISLFPVLFSDDQGEDRKYSYTSPNETFTSYNKEGYDEPTSASWMDHDHRLNLPGPLNKAQDAEETTHGCDYKTEGFPALFSIDEDEDWKYPYTSPKLTPLLPGHQWNQLQPSVP
jgi:hypothetical protein